MNDTATEIERKLARQLARRREREIAEILADIDAENNTHSERRHEETTRHQTALKRLWDELQRYHKRDDQ